MQINCFIIGKKQTSKKKIKLFAVLVVLAVLAFFAFRSMDMAFAGSSLLEQAREGGLDAIGTEVYGTSQPLDIRVIVINVIKVILSILAILFFIYLFWAGYKWMIAGGDSRQVDEAKDQIKNAIFGLIIILVSWAIARWLIYIMEKVTSTMIS
jgi:hypothetical protein